MELGVELPVVTVSKVVDGMRRPFMQAFGRTLVGQRVGRAAWNAYRAALVNGHGIGVATSHALVAADQRNRRTMLVARWTTGRLSRVVHRAARRAADAS